MIYWKLLILLSVVPLHWICEQEQFSDFCWIIHVFNHYKAVWLLWSATRWCILPITSLKIILPITSLKIILQLLTFEYFFKVHVLKFKFFKYHTFAIQIQIIIFIFPEIIFLEQPNPPTPPQKNPKIKKNTKIS